MTRDLSYPAHLRQEKLRTLMQTEGFESETHVLQAAIFASVSRAICLNKECSHTAPMESDQAHGWCEICHTNSMQSALILAGLL